MLDFPDDGQIRFRKIRDAGSVLNATLTFIRRNARELVTSYLALVAPVALASGLALALWFRQFGDVMSDPDALLRGDVQMFGWSYAGVVVFSLVGSALAQAAAAGYVRLYREGQAGTITAGRLWEEARGLMLPYLGLPIVFGVVLTVAAVIGVIPCLGFIAWLAFAVWLIPYYGVTIAARAIDEDSLGGAWARTRDLVKGSWGFAAGSILLTFLIVFVVSFGLMIVLSATMGVAMAGSMANDPAQAMGWMGAIYAPIQVLSYALYAVVFVAFFFVHGRLAEELDGTSLHDDLDVLAEAGFDVPIPSASAPLRSTPPTLDDRPDAPSDPDDSTPPGSGGFRGGGFGA